jgi:hypothetical protein
MHGASYAPAGRQVPFAPKPSRTAAYAGSVTSRGVDASPRPGPDRGAIPPDLNDALALKNRLLSCRHGEHRLDRRTSILMQGPHRRRGVVWGGVYGGQTAVRTLHYPHTMTIRPRRTENRERAGVARGASTPAMRV